jgi:hypothetical protein
MELIELKRRIRRFDLLDYFFIKLAWIIIGIVIATYFTALRGFVQQNIIIVIFIFLAVIIRPVMRYLR